MAKFSFLHVIVPCVLVLGVGYAASGAQPTYDPGDPGIKKSFKKAAKKAKNFGKKAAKVVEKVGREVAKAPGAVVKEVVKPVSPKLADKIDKANKKIGEAAGKVTIAATPGLGYETQKKYWNKVVKEVQRGIGKADDVMEGVEEDLGVTIGEGVQGEWEVTTFGDGAVYPSDAGEMGSADHDTTVMTRHKPSEPVSSGFGESAVDPAYEKARYDKFGFMRPDGSFWTADPNTGELREGAGIGCSGYTAAVLLKMQHGDEWRSEYSKLWAKGGGITVERGGQLQRLKPHMLSGDEQAHYFALPSRGFVRGHKLASAQAVKQLIDKGQLSAGKTYLFSVWREGDGFKEGHTGFVGISDNGAVHTTQFSNVGGKAGPTSIPLPAYLKRARRWAKQKWQLFELRSQDK